MQEFGDDGKSNSPPKTDLPFPGNGKMSPEKEEPIRLRQENKLLKMETEIPNKAVAFLAKESI